MAKKVATFRHDETEVPALELADGQAAQDAEGVHLSHAKPGRRRRSGAVTKSEAARVAIREGYDTPKKAVAFIKNRFGLDMNPQHFSAVKSIEAKKSGLTRKRGRKPAGDSPSWSSPAIPPNGSADLLEAIQTVKTLVASLGADKVKRIVDLLA